MAAFSRTDLAIEAHARADSSALPGVEARERSERGFSITTVHILNEDGSEVLCKPIGRYETISLDPVLRREETSFSDAVAAVASLLRGLCPLSPADLVLVVGLGNHAITPDAIGPRAVESVLATRHLRTQYAGTFDWLRPVASVAPGVLGDTGIESAALVQGLVRDLQPSAVLAIDALACAERDRLCRTVQLTDTGITPGSGVGNDRAALNRDSLGVPVIAVGVPTVMDFPDADPALFITPREIDSVVSDFSRLIGYSINCALHPDLTMQELELLLS